MKVSRTQHQGRVEFDTTTAEFTVVYGKGWGKQTKARVYISSDDPNLPTPPYGIKGENAENDAAWKVYNAEELKIMRADLRAFLSQHNFLFDAIQGADEKLTYSRTAGCSCPCSPGFILEGATRMDGYRVESIHLVMKDTETFRKMAEQRAAREARDTFQAACRFEGLEN